MKRTSPKFVCIAITGLGLAAYSASAAAEQTTVALLNNYLPSMAFPLVPRLTGIGLLGDEEVVGGDGMVPIYGNRNGVWYVDAQGKTAFDSSWVGSLGTGVRLVSSDTNIFGAYVFVDRNISPEKNDFWFISPGLESLGDILDFRVNGYFPTNTKQQYGSTDWADNFGVTDFVTFQGHQQFDILMTQDEEVGSWGGDAEVGARFPGLSNLRAYVGGYHFSFQDASDINGVAGRVELPVNRYLGVTARESYDNVQHNTIMVGLRVTLGGVNTHPADPHQPIQQRLLDPIERNMATLGQGNGEPIQSVLTPVSNGSNPNPPAVERENIWYFSPSATGVFDGTITACTIEAPCINTDFMQATIDGINDLVLGSTEINKLINSTSPSFYLAPGNYNSLNGSGPLTFTNDWIFGRTADFRGDQQAAFLIGGLSFSGTSNQMNYVIAQNSLLFPQNAAVTLNPGSVLTLNHTRLGVDPFLPRMQDLNSDSYHIGIQMQDATVHVNQSSEIYAYATDNANVAGINSNDSLIAGSTITVDSSLIHVLNNLDIGVFGSPNNVVAAGIRTNDLTYKGTTGSSISVVKGDIKASAIGNVESLELGVTGPQVYGILGGGIFAPLSMTPVTLANGGEDITISGSSISASSSITAGVKILPTVMGVSAQSELENRITIDTTDISSDVNVVQGGATGVNASSTSGNAKNDVTITGGNINVDSLLGNAFGINANSRFGSGNNTVTLSGNLQISADANNATGVNMTSGSGNNLITLTGSQLVIAATTISNPADGGLAVGVSEFSSVFGNAGSNRLISSGGVSIAANATGIGKGKQQAIGIQQTNNGAVSGSNEISAVDTSIIANSTLTDGSAGAIGVQMTNPSFSGNAPNLLDISGNSSISVIASTVAKNNATATGIDQNQQNGTASRDNFALINGNTTVTVAATTSNSGTAAANGVLQARVGDGNNTTSTNSPNTKITASSTGDPTSSITYGIRQTITGSGINDSSGFPNGQISVFSNGTAIIKSP